MTQGLGQEPTALPHRVLTALPSPPRQHAAPQASRPFSLGRNCLMHFGEKANPMGLSLQLTPLAAAGDKGKG